MTRPPDPSRLEYAPPAHRAASPGIGVLAGVFGILAGLFALPMLFFGGFGIVYSLMYSKKSNRPGDFFEASMFLVIGLFCALVCIRWCRMKIRRPQPDSTGK